MTEKQRMREQIREGASIVEACENVDLEALIKEGETEIVKAIEDILAGADKLAEALDLFNDDLDE